MVSRVTAMIEILLIEDNPGDVKITVEAFRDAKITTRIRTVETGEDALRYLRGQPPYLDRPPQSCGARPQFAGRERLRCFGRDEGG